MEDPHLLDPCVRRGVPSLRADNVHSHVLGRTETAPEGGIECAAVPLPAPTGTQISYLPPSLLHIPTLEHFGTQEEKAEARLGLGPGLRGGEQII